MEHVLLQAGKNSFEGSEEERIGTKGGMGVEKKKKKKKKGGGEEEEGELTS